MNENRDLSPMTKNLLPLLLLLSVFLTGFIALEIQVHEDLMKEGELIPIAQLVNDQDDAAAAFSSASDQYLVVFEDPVNNGDILGQFIDGKNGELKGGWFYIAVSSGQEYHADVAYDEFHDRFLVVWQKNYCLQNKCYFIIEGRLVHGSYQGSNNWAGNVFQIANGHRPDDTGFDVVYPSLAYNAEDHQFVVVYQQGKFSTGTWQLISGQMIKADADKPEVLTDISSGFEIGKFDSDIEGLYPDVTWSPDGNSFLAVYQTYFPSKTDRITVRYLHDTYQGAGNAQVFGTGGHYVTPHFTMGNVPGVDEYSDPVVTYDPISEYYLIVHTHSEDLGLGIDNRVYGILVENEYALPVRTIGGPIPIETTINEDYSEHFRPDVVYSGVGGASIVTYISSYNVNGEYVYQVNARVVRNGVVGERFKVRTAPFLSAIEDPALAASNDGQALVVWGEEYETDPYDWDINGQRINIIKKIYLPVIVEN